MIRKFRMTFLLAITLVVFVLLGGCEYKETKDPSTFNDLTNNLFVQLIGDDDLTKNYYFENPSNFGLSASEPSLPTPSLTSPIGLLITNFYLGQIKAYDYNQLNTDQQITYNLIMNLLNYINSKNTEMGYLSNNYLGTYLGYQAQLPLLLVEYNFRQKSDVDNYLKYLELIPETFESYYNFEVKKSEKGYGMPNYVIENVVSQCNSFVKGIDSGESFMYTVVDQKIDSCSFLSDSEKTEYKRKNHEAIEDHMREGYAYIAESLPSLKDKSTNNQGLAHYVTSDGSNIGKNYYEIEFKNTVGYDLSCAEAINYIEQKINNYLGELRALYSKISANASNLEILKKIQSGEIELMTSTPEAQLATYQNLINTDFPAPDVNYEIIVKYIDKSMQNNFSPAAYMTSAIDQTSYESIYLNPASIYLKDDNGNLTDKLDANYLYTTLAHEGLPGHLYQNLYFKTQDTSLLRKILRNSGYVEGWATYAENYSYNFLRGTYSDDVIDYLITQSKLEAAIYSRLDLGIHYNGWSLEEFSSFTTKYFGVSSQDRLLKAYQQLVEIPNNYQQYFFTYLKFVDMYDNVKTKLGNNFNAKDFHKTILDCGPLPLKYVEKIVYDKYDIK